MAQYTLTFREKIKTEVHALIMRGLRRESGVSLSLIKENTAK
jgi:hypothetical protein